MDTPINTELSLEYGDIIEIHAPSNSTLHENTFYIVYRDDEQVDLYSVATEETISLSINKDDMSFTDESIEKIVLISRSEELGFARQNNLLPNTWVEIHIGGDVKQIITGEITNLEEDQIEITTYPDMQQLFIDFEYKGLPKHLPILSISIRGKPDALQNVESLTVLQETLDQEDDANVTLEELQDKPNIEFTEEGESIINIPDGTVSDEQFKEHMESLYIDANDIIFGEELETIQQIVELPEEERKYSVETQINDFMDELLSTIPNSKRTISVMSNIHRLLTRFKELREKYSVYDNYNNITDKKKYGPSYKPLIEKLKNMDKNLEWLIPTVSNTKFIYDEHENPTTDTITIENNRDSLANIENQLNQFHTSKLGGLRGNYKGTYNRVFNEMKYFDTNMDDPNAIYTTQVKGYIQGIVNNLENFYSGVYSHMKFSQEDTGRKRFFIQTYQLGESQLVKKGQHSKDAFIREQMTPSDDIAIKSYVMLPHSVANHSKSTLPNTNILTRATIHQQPIYLFKLLHKNKHVRSVVLDELSEELDFKENENYLKAIQEFSVNMNNLQEEPNVYEKYLQTFIPKTKQLLTMVRNTIKNKHSFVEIVDGLEPFSIYPEHITYSQYQEIRHIINERITALKQKYATSSNDVLSIREQNIIPKLSSNSFMQLFMNKPDFLEEFYTTYFMNADKSYSSSEIFSRLFNEDNMKLFTLFITAMLISLVTSSDILNNLYPGEIEEERESNPFNSDCGKKYIAKKYTSLDDLNEDNNKDTLFFDKDYDLTPYHLLEKYKEDRATKGEELFKEFLVTVLHEKHGIPRDDAPTMANNLLSNKLPVEDGHYAMLETSEDDTEDTSKNRTYYIRKKDNWIADNTINESAFIDTATLFCNISKECFFDKKKELCEGLSDTDIRLRNESKQALLDEFDKRLRVSVQEMEANMNQDINQLLRTIRTQRIIREINLYTANNIAKELGKQATKNDTLESPHTKLLQLILGQSDFVKKQQDIVNFIAKHGRSAIPLREESNYWFYCKDTNTQLLPTSLYELANAFLVGSYLEKLEELRVSQGVESDDGDAIVDKHSGVILCKKDFNIEEGYDEQGFRIVTRDIIEEDAGKQFLKTVEAKTSLLENSESRLIDTIYYALIDKLSLPSEFSHDLVLRISSDIIHMNVSKEADYKGKDAYTTYYNQLVVLIVSGTLFSCVQTAIPSINISKTFPNCVRSFTGFPLTNDEDISGIHYISCVLNKIKSSFSPWSSITKLSIKKLETRLHKVLSSLVVGHPNIIELYTKFRESGLLAYTATIPKEHSLDKWPLFQPSMVDIDMDTSLQNISSHYSSELLQEMKKGRLQQFKMINTIRSKNTLFSYLALQTFHNIVSKEDTLLKTRGMVPFQENACCHNNEINPLIFMAHKEEIIKTYLTNIRNNQLLLNGVKETITPPLLYNNEFTGVEYPMITSGNMEENVYSSIIKHCGFDKNMEVPEQYKSICSEKPQDYDSKSSLVDKIALLKRKGKRFTETDMKNLMNIVHKENIINIDTSKPDDPITVFKEYIDYLEEEDSTVISTNLRRLLGDVIEEYEPSSLKTEYTKKQDDLYIHLYHVNKDLTDEILYFMESFRQPEFQSYLNDISEWEFYEENKHGFLQLTRQLTNSIYNLAMVYPSSLLIRSEHVNSQHYHSNFYLFNLPDPNSNIWRISEQHFIDLKKVWKDYYSPLDKLNNDPLISNIIAHTQDNLSVIYKFTNLIPLHKNNATEDGSTFTLFDEKMSVMLLKYCLLTTIHQYIITANDENIVQISTNLIRQHHRNTVQDEIESAGQGAPLDVQRNEDNDEEYDLLEQVNIDITSQMDVKEKAVTLLASYFTMERKQKKTVNMSYENIIKKVTRSAQKERKEMTDYLGKMTIEERKVSDMHKKLRLGEWNIGTHSSIYKYDRKTYIADENKQIGFFDVTEQPVEIADEEPQEEFENNFTRDTHDIAHLPNEYNDGDFYPEEQDPDDFYGED